MKKYALVTGSSDRIGKAIALQLVDMGYNLVLHYRQSREKAVKFKEEILAKGAAVKLLQLDFLQRNDCDNTFRSLKAEGIALDVLVNSASDLVRSDFETQGSDTLTKQFKSNFEAAYLLTKAFARVYHSGSIINLLDTKVEKDWTNHLDYLLSKKLLKEFTKLAASELAPDIRVNAIAPGLILPPQNENMAYLEKLAKNIPLQKVGDLADIRRAVAFLTESSFVTGQVLYIDGGEHLNTRKS